MIYERIVLSNITCRVSRFRGWRFYSSCTDAGAAPTADQLLNLPPQSSSSSKNKPAVESLVGYPSPLLKILRHVMASHSVHLPDLVQRFLSSNHPAATSNRSKRLFDEIFNGSHSPGLVTLLTSKAVNMLNPTLPDQDQFGITPSQRLLAEITEMINIANLIHSEVVDLSLTSDLTQVKGLEFGNKLLILGGDILLARASKELALLYRPQVVGIISQAIGDMMTGNYLKRSLTTSSTMNTYSDPDTPISPGPLVKTLEPQSLCRSRFHLASLLSSSCQCCAIVGELDEPTQLLVSEIGRNLSIVQQIVYCCQSHEKDLSVTEKKEETLWQQQHMSALAVEAKDAGAKAMSKIKQLPTSKSKDELIRMLLGMLPAGVS